MDGDNKLIGQTMVKGKHVLTGICAALALAVVSVGFAWAAPEDEEPELPGAFLESEYTVQVGDVVAVGFVPEAADADSEDEDRAAWYENWKSTMETSKVSLTSESGWLATEDEGGDEIDYGEITGITTSDETVFNLFGEFPGWKTDDGTGVEYRWWYGLLGRAEKAGDATLSIVYRQDDGGDFVAGTCTVHVVDSPEEGSVASGQFKGKAVESVLVENGERNLLVESESSNDGDGFDANDETAGEAAGLLSTQSTEDDGETESSATSARDNTTSSTLGKSSESDSSDESNKTSDAASSAGETATSTSSSTRSATETYPKEVASTAADSKVAATLLVNDAATASALSSLANGAKLTLVAEVKDKLADASETRIAAVENRENLQIAERISLQVVDNLGSKVDLSDMNLTVRIALDDALKAIGSSEVQVWYAADDGSKAEKMEASISDGYLSFQTSHLSDFVVMSTKATSSAASTDGGTAISNTSSGTATGTTTAGAAANKTSSLPQTGDTLTYLAILLALVAGFSASTALNARKRMKEI